MCKIIKFFVFCLFFFSATLQLGAEIFRFQYNPEHSYRILSTVEEDVIINGIKHHVSTIINRISVKETAVFDDGSANIKASFMTTENSARKGELPRYVWGAEYFSSFQRSALGLYTIDASAFMPVVRNVPVFPDRDIKAGDTWTAQGEEAHDMRAALGIEKPFKVPFSAAYTYKGSSLVNGKTLHIILVSYTLFYETPIENYSQNKGQLGIIPLTTMGYSNQTLYWDNDRGFLDHYSERFRIIMHMNTGDTIEYRGTAHAETTDLKPINSAENLALVQKRIKELGIADASVRSEDRGLTISLENIQFEAESAVLRASEKIKLQKIAQILSSFPENDLLISGHTALAGTAPARQRLSEERASVVADYLAELGLKRHEQLFTRGLGAESPLAPNDTEANKSRNRRVEITILDK